MKRNFQETATPYTRNLPCAKCIIKNKEKIKGIELGERSEVKSKEG